MAIRDNRIAAESVGVNVTKYKMIAFSLSAALSGHCGVLYAHNFFFARSSSKFDYNTSILILVFGCFRRIGNTPWFDYRRGCSDSFSGTAMAQFETIIGCRFARLF